jgi:hypothetical protein
MRAFIAFILEQEDDVEVNTDEALTVQQRIKRSQSMKRNAKKIQRKKKMKEKRTRSTDELKTKAQKAARMLIFKKFSKGKNPASMGAGEKSAIEKKVDKKGALIKKIAKKMLPKLKAAEKERVKAARSRGKEDKK